jgi:hypothetical protein
VDQSRWRGKESAMKRLLFVGSVTFWMLSPQIGDAWAAGPYDGEWSGSATAITGRCGPALVTLTVEGKVVTGQARFDRDVANISGTALENGSVGATIGFRHLTGNFTKDMFEGTFDGFGCSWKVILKIKKPQ